MLTAFYWLATAFFWLVAATAGALICADSCRKRWQARTTLPTLADVTGTRARLGVGRDITQHWGQMALAAGIGIFCVLVALGAILRIATGLVGGA